MFGAVVEAVYADERLAVSVAKVVGIIERQSKTISEDEKLLKPSTKHRKDRKWNTTYSFTLEIKH